MTFAEYMERYWEGYTRSQREFVEADALYQIHCAAKDQESACGRAEDILKNRKLRNQISEERFFKALDEVFDSN